MQNNMLQEAAKFLIRNRRHQVWKKIVSVMACMVVFCTTYALILPAITLEKYKCGMEEHIHTDACYTQVTSHSRREPVCSEERLDIHRHTEDCWDENGEIVCGFADFVIHTHTSLCYDGDGHLWCPLPEIEPHTHRAGCYEEPSRQEVHTHTDACYTVELGELICTKSTESAHTHTEACYTETEELVCSIPESDGHQHGSDCYKTTSKLICSLSEEPHQHTDDCYVRNKVLTCQLSTEPAEPEGEPAEPELICGKEEIALHTHGEDCFDEDGSLICGQMQVLEHVHTAECFRTVEEAADTETLTCTIPEGAGGHTHSEEAGCFDETGRLICRLEESDGHQHGPRCYGIWELTCGLEEHTHSEKCSAALTDDPKEADSWEASLPESISEKWDQAVVGVAESQIGYRESEQDYTEDVQGEIKGYTRYGAWYGDPYGDWDAMFVSFCLHYAGIPAEVFPQDASCSRWVEKLQTEEYGFYQEKNVYVPKAGDLVFFDFDQDCAADHVGIAAELLAAAETETMQVRVIEGDSDHCVRAVIYEADDPAILGYGALPERALSVYQWSQGGLEVTATFAPGTVLPENARLTVERLSPEAQESAGAGGYAAAPAMLSEEADTPLPYVEEADTPLSYVDRFRIYLEADGEEILPQAQANVEIRLQEEQYPATLGTELLRYSEEGMESIALDPDASGDLTGSFDTDMSSEYAVVSTLAADVPPQEQDTPEEAVFTPRKTIDAFRDGADNPDTTLDNTSSDRTDLYRLYLDAELSGNQTPIDLLIVVDQSGSMHMDYASGSDKFMDMLDEDGETAIFRDQAVRLVLNGTYDESTYPEKAQNGLISQFLAANDENNVAVVGFQGRAYDGSFRYELSEEAAPIYPADGSWTSDPQYINVVGKSMNGTNYCAGMLVAGEVLDDPAIQNNGHKKVMLFLSDGYPTFYFYKPWLGSLQRRGDGGTMDSATKSASMQYFNELRAKHPDLITYTVGISEDVTGTNSSGTASDEVLRYMADTGGGAYFGVNATDDLRNTLKKLMFGTIYSNLSIQDTLSEYVDLYTDQPDYKVVMRNPDGTETVLFENGAVTEQGAGILQTVDYDASARRVFAVFEPTYTPKPGSTVTLSFNVKTAQTAYDTYAKSGYPVNGEENTDYGGNATSSGQPGFRSNTSATLTYLKDGNAGQLEYPHPVVQAVACKFVIQKTDGSDPGKTLPGAEFALYRKAGDGETGTSLEGLEGSYINLREKIATDENGQAVVDGLVPGEYWLLETKAPTNYRKLSAPIPFTLTRGTDGSGQIAGSSATITIGEEILPELAVTNTFWGHELPKSGGIGTSLYTAGGLLTLCVFCLLLYRNKKGRKEDFASS